MDQSVSIIIPNWNGLRHLRTCLEAVLRQTYPVRETVLVDNGSTDGSCEFVAAHYPGVRILRCETNLGFAAATNLGIRRTQGDYVATLNNDTEVEPAWLEELVKAMDADSRVGMCASKMLFYDQRHVINSAGISVDRAGIAWDRDGGTPDDANDNTPQDVFGPCAGAALYRRAMLEETGLFDEDYTSYLEDVDLAWRGQALGWRCRYVPAARVYHVHSATGKENSPFKNYLLGRNKWWTTLKNYPWPQWLPYGPLILLYDGMAALYSLARGRTCHGVRGRWAAWRSCRDALSKRRAIQSAPRYSARLAFDCLSPLASPLRVWQRFRHLLEHADHARA